MIIINSNRLAHRIQRHLLFTRKKIITIKKKTFCTNTLVPHVWILPVKHSVDGELLSWFIHIDFKKPKKIQFKNKIPPNQNKNQKYEWTYVQANHVKMVNTNKFNQYFVSKQASIILLHCPSHLQACRNHSDWKINIWTNELTWTVRGVEIIVFATIFLIRIRILIGFFWKKSTLIHLQTRQFNGRNFAYKIGVNQVYSISLLYSLNGDSQSH